MTTAATVLVAGVFLCCLPAWCSATDGEMCYTSGSVAGIVIATVVVTIVVGGLAAAGVWYLWKQRTALAGSGKKPGSVFFGSTENGCTLENHPSEKSAIEGGKEAYAFDNPYFKDDETDLGKPNQDAAEKGEAGFREDNGEIKNSANKVSSGQKPKKSRPFSNITFPNVFHQTSKKPRALDDSFIAKPLERVEVPLRGHDFTGLGFNICGNMRDGIFVKDVLHRGPASESGKIKAGDRIIGVRVSFSGMVYEDALTILSYASPYDVRLELEKTAEADRSRHLALQASSPATKTRLGSSSFRTGQRLFHPLYRSQSFDDLTQIAVTACKGPYTNCPKRSQSIETAATPKPRVHMTPTNSGKKSSANSSTSSTESSSKKADIAKVSDEGCVAKASAESPKAKSARFHVENFLRQKKAPVVVQNTAISKEKREVLEAGVKLSPEVPLNQPTHQEPEEPEPDPAKPEEEEEEEDTIIKAEVQNDSRPTAPPRKAGVHVKRKAPAPPQKSGEAADTTETSAVVHRDAEDDSVSEMSQDVQPDQGESVELSDSQSTQALHYVKSDGIVEIVKENDVHSVSGESLPTSTEEADSGSSTKRKASSLGDLTKLDASGHKKSPVTTTILERAVSLDLQQSLPEGNLVKQKMVLRAPTFEDPEDVGEEDFATLKNQPSGNLKRWEGSWSGLQEDAKTSEKEDKSEEIWTISSKTVINGDTDDVLSMEERSTLIPFDPGFKREDEQQQLRQTDSEPQDGGSSSIRITSTPIKKIIETESFFKNDVDLDDIPYLGDCSAIKDDQSSENTSATSSASAGNPRPVTSPSATSPISLSIPIIKPDFSQYEKLPSPLSPVKPQTTESFSGPADDKKRHDSGSQSAEERALGNDSSAANSSYEPVFVTETASVLKTSNFVSSEDTSNNKSEITGTKIISALDIVNGNGFGAPSYSHYRTALEDELSESSTMEPTPADSSSATDFSKKTTLAEISSIKVHSGAAGFAKTLIISTPIEGESISLNADLDSPPPQLEPPQ